ncbi:hypothetical protein, partial [Escherichia coli]|uniref:hypothetical protein n=1 Tax=Escherichia coli TaxID=562 RepID=UPI001F03C42F
DSGLLRKSVTMRLADSQDLHVSASLTLVRTSLPATNSRVSTSWPDALTLLSTSEPASGTWQGRRRGAIK